MIFNIRPEDYLLNISELGLIIILFLGLLNRRRFVNCIIGAFQYPYPFHFWYPILKVNHAHIKHEAQNNAKHNICKYLRVSFDLRNLFYYEEYITFFWFFLERFNAQATSNYIIYLFSLVFNPLLWMSVRELIMNISY